MKITSVLLTTMTIKSIMSLDFEGQILPLSKFTS